MIEKEHARETIDREGEGEREWEERCGRQREREGGENGRREWEGERK